MYILHGEPAESWHDWFSHMFPISLEYDRGGVGVYASERGQRKKEQLGM